MGRQARMVRSLLPFGKGEDQTEQTDKQLSDADVLEWRRSIDRNENFVFFPVVSI
ncbi:hypothetical protein DSCW_37100 [Desulfosarcina widdelii]|uniref:Uncharacterized protein n=1 Tax=Desulfosarcina widdelii TaxID=947919 RepID=A0A5K7Z8W0_9BACT|nr:hypothetical protein DSCW_37100 [Desulfosarcina widdelii]